MLSELPIVKIGVADLPALVCGGDSLSWSFLLLLGIYIFLPSYSVYIYLVLTEFM